MLFLSAKVIGPGSGYDAPNLTCSYALLAMPHQEMARIGRPVPAGMRCAVDAAVPSRFDCLPVTLPPAATTPVTPHNQAPTVIRRPL